MVTHKHDAATCTRPLKHDSNTHTLLHLVFQNVIDQSVLDDEATALVHPSHPIGTPGFIPFELFHQFVSVQIDECVFCRDKFSLQNEWDFLTRDEIRKSHNFAWHAF